MQFPCTIFARRFNLDAIVSRFEHEEAHAEAEGATTRVFLSGPLGTLRLSALQQEGEGEPRSKFSKMILGMMNWAQRTAGGLEPASEVLAFISECNYVIGCVLEPTPEREEDAIVHFGEFVAEIATAFEGLIFVGGNRLINGQGETILE